jgi:hypoxanthine phosphoribosyltransferase
MPFSNHASAVKGDRSNSKQVARELSWAEFGRYIQDLARQAAGFKPDAVVGIAHGGVFVGGAVASALKVEFYPVRLLRRSRESETRRPSGLSDEMPTELSGCRVLVVDDVCSSGDSLEMAGRLARAAGCSKVKTAALVTRPKGARPDYSALTTEALFVFPWDYQAVVEDERFEQKRMGGSGRSGSKRKPASLEAHDDVVLGV